MENVVAYVTETPSFSSPNPKEGRLMNKKDAFVATYPNEVFLTLVADDSGLGAEYELEFSFTDLDGDEMLRLQQEAAAEAEKER